MQFQPSSLLRFLAYVKPYWKPVFIASVGGVLKSVIPLSIPWSVKAIVDGVLSKPHHGEALRELHIWVAGLVLMYLFWIVASYVRIYFTGLAGNRVIFDLRHGLFLHLQRMSLSFFDRRKIGAVVSRMTADISQAQNVVGHGVTSALMDVSSIAVIAVILFCVHWKLAFVSLAMIPFYVLVNKHFMKKIQKSSRIAREHMENLAGSLHEHLAAISTVQSFSREKEQETDFLDECRGHLDAVLTNVHEQALGLSLIGFFAGVAPILVLWFGAMNVMSGSLTVGTLIAFYAYIGLLYMPLARLSELGLVISNSLAAIERIFEVFDTYPDVQERRGAFEVESVSGRIEFRDITFGYETGNEVLKDFNLVVNPGEVVALVGASGAGKSTVVKLLFRFYEVCEGAILIDGVDIRDLKLSSLRNQIALVSQEPILFSGTILENILYGKPESTQEEVIRAAQAAGAHPFILELQNQYETFVGERGATLSVGEKQRIALARAFLKNAPILVLDEPTSALDHASASEMSHRLQALMKGRATLVISHRPSAIKNADRIIRLREGRAIEEPVTSDHTLRLAF